MCMSHDQPKSPNSLNQIQHQATSPLSLLTNPSKIKPQPFLSLPASPLSLSLSPSLHHRSSPPPSLGSNTINELNSTKPFSLQLLLLSYKNGKKETKRGNIFRSANSWLNVQCACTILRSDYQVDHIRNYSQKQQRPFFLYLQSHKGFRALEWSKKQPRKIISHIKLKLKVYNK